jgi:flagellar basal-body rod protein FlgC
MDMMKTMMISASGMKAQGKRLRVISENIANADSVGREKGDEPYRRKLVTFRNTLDRQLGIKKVSIDKVIPDQSDFERKYDPAHPAADEDGYLRLPNVKPLVEMMDMREAQRSYEANLNVIEVTKRMLMQTIDLLRK